MRSLELVVESRNMHVGYRMLCDLSPRPSVSRYTCYLGRSSRECEKRKCSNRVDFFIGRTQYRERLERASYGCCSRLEALCLSKGRSLPRRQTFTPYAFPNFPPSLEHVEPRKATTHCSAISRGPIQRQCFLNKLLQRRAADKAKLLNRTQTAPYVQK